MLPAARVNATIEILERTGESRVPMDSTVGDYMRNRRYIGAKDRADIAERTYNIVRVHARLGWWLARGGVADTPRTRLIAWLCLGEGKDPRRFFDGSKFGAAPLTPEEEKFATSLKGHTLIHPDMPEAVRVECPPEFEAALRAVFGAGFADEMTAMLGAAPLDLRVNTRAASREEAQAGLAAAGIETDPTPYADTGLRARGKVFLGKSKPFVKGWVEIQDEGSQLIAQVCGAQPGIQVLDYCAGAGGKTLALAAAMQNKGRIVAMDTEKGRLEKARQRFRRAGVHDIIEVRALEDERNKKWLKRQKGTFDVVLADVPCSGTGTWRRNPDLRWRAFGPALPELIQTQSDILARTARTVKPGGRLVYATCSLLPEENERQIEKFLQQNPQFITIVAAAPGADENSPYMRLTPYRHNTDGFFAAVMQRDQAISVSSSSEEDDDA